MKLFGTDFSLMEKMFPGRQRKALKFKLRREYKDNPERIDAALSGKGCDASSYQEVVKALHKVRRQSLSCAVQCMAWVRERLGHAFSIALDSMTSTASHWILKIARQTMHRMRAPARMQSRAAYEPI